MENIKSIKSFSSKPSIGIAFNDQHKSIISATTKKDSQNSQSSNSQGTSKLESSLSQAPGITYLQRPNPGQSTLTLNPNLGNLIHNFKVIFGE